MSKCSNCGKQTRVLASSGDLLLCKECAASYQDLQRNESSKWLIRTTDGKILGPYSFGPLKELIESKKVVFLDEVSRSGEDWMLIKNVPSFKNIALGSDYELTQGTANVVREDLAAEHPAGVKHPPAFKHKHRKRPEAPSDILPTPILIQSPQPEGGDMETSLWWWKNKRLVFISLTVVIVAALSTTLYLIKNSKRDLDMFSNVPAGTDAFNRYYIEGRELEEGGLFKDALRYYDRALSMKSSHSGARIRKAAIDLVVMNRMEPAQRELEKLYSDTNIGKITDQEEQTDIKTFLGILEAKKGNNQSAIGYFNQALAMRPTNAYLYYNIGVILFRQAAYTECLEYFRNAQKLQPMFADAVLYEGRTLMELGRFKDAARVFADGAMQNPNIRQFYTFGSYAVFKGQGVDRSLDTLKRITSIDPYYQHKIFSPLSQLEAEETIAKEINNTIEMMKSMNDVQRLQADYLLALLYFTDGNYDAASKILAQSERENNAIAQLILGAIAYHQTRYEEASKRIAKSLEMDYSSNLAHVYAGQLALRRDDLGQAKNHFTKAQASDEPTSLYAITLLGDINVRLGETNQANVLWKKVLSMDSHYMPAWQRIVEFNRRSRQ